MRPPTLLLHAAASLLISCTPAQRAATAGGPGDASATRNGTRAQHDCRRPALIVQITVDQLRGDLVGRYLSRFGAGGFRRFVEQGTWYQAAHYRHAITETAPGHATLATGADPRAHGIVANDWLDADSGEVVYNTSDARSPPVGVEGTGKAGRSPRNLLAPTLADQIVTAGAGRGRAFAVSIKDRGAILPAGRLGKAVWYDKATGRFVSSAFYGDALPKWVASYNASEPWRDYEGQSWTPADGLDSYLFGQHDDEEFERGGGGFGNTFPHDYGRSEQPGFFERLAYSPAGDEMLLGLVRSLLETEHLGAQRHVTDYLAISFSSTDYVGHLWGPSSLESEDNLRRLDVLLAQLLDLLDTRVGLERTLVVLSADHGVGEVPELRARQGFAADNFGMESFDFAGVDARLRARGVEEKLYGVLRAPYVWLDPEAVERAGLEAADARALLAEAFAGREGVRAAFTREQLVDDEPADDPLLERARRSFFPGRSGDLHLVPEPYTLLSLYPGGQPLTASHGTPWQYDTHVPILVLGPGVPRGRVGRRVGPHAIAPSLALRAGAPLPAAAVGEVLDEVVSCR